VARADDGIWGVCVRERGDAIRSSPTAASLLDFERHEAEMGLIQIFVGSSQEEGMEAGYLMSEQVELLAEPA
jgi:hypothetical protein